VSDFLDHFASQTLRRRELPGLAHPVSSRRKTPPLRLRHRRCSGLPLATQQAPCAQSAITTPMAGTAIIRNACNSPRVTGVMIAVQTKRTRPDDALSQSLSSFSESNNNGMNSNRISPLIGPNTNKGQSVSPSLAVCRSPVDHGGKAAQPSATECRALAPMASQRAPRQEMIGVPAAAYLNAPTLTKMRSAVAAKRQTNAATDTRRSRPFTEARQIKAASPQRAKVAAQGVR